MAENIMELSAVISRLRRDVKLMDNYEAKHGVSITNKAKNDLKRSALHYLELFQRMHSEVYCYE